MSLSLLLPLGLAALAALIVPLVIHLIRQPQRDVVDFAALRWLGERARPRRRLRFDDVALLLVRLLLLGVIALLLALPVLDRDPRAPGSVIAVVPDIGAASARAHVSEGEAEWRWLAPGFPSLDEPAPAPSTSIASLVRELDAALDSHAHLTILAPSVIDGLDGERPITQRAIDWRVLDVPIETEATRATSAQRAIRVALRMPQGDATAALPVRAAVAAWNVAKPGSFTLDAATPDVALESADAWLIWLGSDLSPAARSWLDAGGRALIVGADEETAGAVALTDATGGVLARSRASGKGRLVTLVRPFEPAQLPAMLDADFPSRLRALFEDEPPAPTRAFAATMAPRIGAAAATPPTFSLDAWIAAVVVLLFVLERVLATRRRRAT